MTIVIVIAVVVVAFIALVFLVGLQGRKIARRRSVDLARATGLPADEIFKELWEKRMTPGEWAAGAATHG